MAVHHAQSQCGKFRVPPRPSALPELGTGRTFDLRTLARHEEGDDGDEQEQAEQPGGFKEKGEAKVKAEEKGEEPKRKRRRGED